MLSICGQIQTLESLGTVLLSDQASITAAQQSNQKIIDALNNYVAVLGSQGINPPHFASFALIPDDVYTMAIFDLDKYIASIEPNQYLHRAVKLEAVSRMMYIATEKFAQKDTGSYLAIMSRAVKLNTYVHKPFLSVQ